MNAETGGSLEVTGPANLANVSKFPAREKPCAKQKSKAPENGHLRSFSDLHTHVIFSHTNKNAHIYICAHKRYKIQRFGVFFVFFVFETGSYYACITDFPTRLSSNS